MTDRNGRVYRVGETDIDIMGRKRKWMVILPWVGMMGISSAEYAFASAEDTLHEAHHWSSGSIYWMMTAWVFCQAAVAFPAGRLRENGKLPARWAMMLGSVGTLLGYLSLAFAPHVALAFIGFGVFSGMGAGMVYATCVNMVGKWYPERRGGKTGFVNGGFAYGSVPFVFIFHGYMDGSNFRWVLVASGVFLAGVVAVAGFYFRDPPKNWWPDTVDPLNPPDDPRARRSLEKNPPAVKQYSPMEAWRTGRVALMWFCLACTSGVNIFGIAFQVDIGEEAGFAAGHRGHRDVAEGDRQRHRAGCDRLALRPVRPQEVPAVRVRDPGPGPVRHHLVGGDQEPAAVPDLLRRLRLRRRRHLPDVRGAHGGLLRGEQQRHQLRHGVQLQAGLGARRGHGIRGRGRVGLQRRLRSGRAASRCSPGSSRCS